MCRLNDRLKAMTGRPLCYTVTEIEDGRLVYRVHDDDEEPPDKDGTGLDKSNHVDTNSNSRPEKESDGGLAEPHETAIKDEHTDLDLACSESSYFPSES